jgi:hypothetical protein
MLASRKKNQMPSLIGVGGMLPLIDKYHHRRPVIPYRNYASGMLRGDVDAHFEALVRFIDYASDAARHAASTSAR